MKIEKDHCVHCGTVEEISLEENKRLKKSLSREEIWKVIHNRHILCPECQEPFLTSKMINKNLVNIFCQSCSFEMNYNIEQEVSEDLLKLKNY